MLRPGASRKNSGVITRVTRPPRRPCKSSTTCLGKQNERNHEPRRHRGTEGGKDRKRKSTWFFFLLCASVPLWLNTHALTELQRQSAGAELPSARALPRVETGESQKPHGQGEPARQSGGARGQPQGAQGAVALLPRQGEVHLH